MVEANRFPPPSRFPLLFLGSYLFRDIEPRAGADRALTDESKAKTSVVVVRLAAFKDVLR
jgi:hypothetical protein